MGRREADYHYYSFVDVDEDGRARIIIELCSSGSL